MPVRSLHSSVFKWPDRQTVHQAVCDWVERTSKNRKDVLRAGYMGSYARGDWGVGSDLDLIVILEGDEMPTWDRTAGFDISNLPVPTDLIVYAEGEWRRILEQDTLFSRTVQREAIWVYANHPE